MSEQEKMAREEAIKHGLKLINEAYLAKLKEIFTRKKQTFDFEDIDSVEKIEEALTGVIADELFEFETLDNAPEHADLREQHVHLYNNLGINKEMKDLVIKYYVDVGGLDFKSYFASLKIKDGDTAFA